MNGAGEISDILSTNSLVTTPLSSERRTSCKSIPLVTFNAQEKDHDGNNSETDHSVKKMKHDLYNIQETVHNLQTTENLVAMIKVRSVLVLIGIILSVILLFQIPIIL